MWDDVGSVHESAEAAQVEELPIGEIPVKRRPRVLAITPFLYEENPKSGGELAARNVLQALSQDCDLQVLSFEHSKNRTQPLTGMTGYITNFHPVELDLSKLAILRAKASLLRLKPKGAALFRNDVAQRLINNIIERDEIDVLLCQFPQTAQFVDTSRQVRTVLDVQDAFSVSFWRRFRSAKGLLRRVRAFVEWVAWLRYEHTYYGRFDELFCLSDQDKFGLTLFNPMLKPKVVPPMTDLPDSLPARPEGRHTIGFFASFKHDPNVEGLEWFLDCILPRVTAAIPTTRLEIAGSDLPPRLAGRLPVNATFHGFVENLSAFITSQNVVVAPLLSGGGVKIKTLQALQHGAATISTSIGAEGLDVRDGENILVRDDEASFADAVIRLLQADEDAATLGRSAYERFKAAAAANSPEEFVRRTVLGSRT